MHRVLSVNNKKEVVISVPQGEVVQEQGVIFIMDNRVGAEITINDILRAQVFPEKYRVKELILIINQDGLSFLPSIYYGR